ncbi:MAG: hypothetical protein KGH55_00080 [Nanoarchaeota archaeon]|nr:hypothetical protein [Nanoarchaeota archaeon]
MINKKGELTTTQIVMIIVLIVSFIVILYFFYRLNLGATSNSEICHNSVVLQSKSAKIAPGGLQCKTDYICISGGGKCSDMNPTVTLTVDPADKNAVMKAIADQMVNCWYEFGEGKLNYIGISDKDPLPVTNCAICSTIGFDNTISSQNYHITYSDFYNFLMNTKKDNSQTYLQYLYGVSDISTLQSENPVAKDMLNNNLAMSQKYAISTGFYSGAVWGLFKNRVIYPDPVTINQISSELKCSNFITQA